MENRKSARKSTAEKPPIDFRQAQEELRATLRQGMLDAATRLLTEEGPSAMTVRRVAEAVNCSTTLLYSLFGGKDGLANELYLEGFARLKDEFRAASEQATSRKEGKEDMSGLEPLKLHARVYHQYARRNPSYYMVMFGDAIAGFVPPVESRKQAWESLAVLIDTCDACMKSGALPPSNPTAAARLLWAAMHGAVSLELKGYYLKTERADELFDAAVNAVLLSLKMGKKEVK
ncbi:MAG TPA: TetR/AcrR family transcriptional regulator [Noviherbaspirillum sp.]|nr:TetR/AcrR family transcriptional regulator [Noviherbaspirillum sp.]